MHLSRKTCHNFYLHYKGKLIKEKVVKENLLVCTADKGTCQGKLASVNEALLYRLMTTWNLFVFFNKGVNKLTVTSFMHLFCNTS